MAVLGNEVILLKENCLYDYKIIFHFNRIILWKFSLQIQ